MEMTIRGQKSAVHCIVSWRQKRDVYILANRGVAPRSFAFLQTTI